MPDAAMPSRIGRQRPALRPRRQSASVWVGALAGLIVTLSPAAELVFGVEDSVASFVEIQTTAAHVHISAKLAGANLGAWLSAGDLNGDGIDDLAIGTQADDPKHPGNGVVLLLSQNGQRHWRATILPAPDGEVRFGSRAEIGPDLNNDGIRDLIVSSVASPDRNNAGAVYVYQGRADGSWRQPDWQRILGGRLSVQLGSVTATGDINGDGLPDLAIGCGSATNRLRNEGKVEVFLGRNSSLPTRTDWEMYGGAEGVHLGSAVCLADVNGDGYADLLVGAPLWSKTEDRRGRVQVYLGSSKGLAKESSWTSRGETDYVWFGAGMVNAGDQDGDGTEDVWITAPGRGHRAARNHHWNGRVYLYHGSPQGLRAAPSSYVEGDHVTDWFGGLISTAADLDGDGHRDLLVGIREYGVNDVPMGALDVYSFAHSVPARRLRLVGTAEAGLFGAAHSGTGDFDGDGKVDLAVSSRPERRGEVTILLSRATGSVLQPALPTHIRREMPEAMAMVAPAWHAQVGMTGGWQFIIGASLVFVALVLFLVWRQRHLAMQSARAERARIAADLHDGMGARLAELAQLADGVAATQSHDTELRQRIQKISDASRQTLDSLNEAVSELKAGVTSIAALTEAIAAEAERQLRQAGIGLRITWPEEATEVEVSEPACRALRLGTREALHNLIRHAHATEVRLQFEVEATRFSVAISDNGSGFEPALVKSSRGGLRHGEARLREAGCEWNCETSPGKGTRITMAAPCQARIGQASKP